MNEITKLNTNAQLSNKKLTTYVGQLNKAALSMQSQAYKVAFIVAKIAEEEVWQDDFETFEAFGESMMGVKKATLYNMVKLGRDWTDGKGHSVLYNGEPDYSTSQMYQLMRVKVENGDSAVDLVKAWNEEGIINPLMSVAQIKEVVQAHNAAFKKPKAEKEEAEGKEKAVVTEVSAEIQNVEHTLEWLHLGDKFTISLDGRAVEVHEKLWLDLLNEVNAIIKA